MAAAPLLLHVFSTFAVGGAQIRFATIVNHFGHDFRHAVVAMDGDIACREQLSSELDLSFPVVEVRKGDTLGNVRRFRGMLRELRPATLVTSNWGSIEWAMANVPSLVPHLHMEDGFGPQERDRQLPRRVWTRRLLLRRATVAVPSQRLFRIARDVWRLPPARLAYVPNGIDLVRFAPAPVVDRAVPVIGTVAALRAEKNIARLLRAFAQLAALRPGHLVVAGDGPDRLMLEALAARLGIAGRVTFTGHIADTTGLYAGFDLFALSSDTEQMPISVLEAMAAGLPVVSTDVGDVRNMLAPPNGPFVVLNDDAALCAAMTELLDDARLRRRLGAANRARAEQAFGQGAMFAAWRALYEGRPVGALPPAGGS